MNIFLAEALPREMPILRLFIAEEGRIEMELVSVSCLFEFIWVIFLFHRGGRGRQRYWIDLVRARRPGRDGSVKKEICPAVVVFIPSGSLWAEHSGP